jgi:hypothetical protein
VTDLDVLRRRYARLNGERATQPMALSRLESRLEVAP